MKTLTSTINVQVDERDKEQANNILKDLGGKTNPKPSDELLDALKEGEEIIQEIKDGKRTGYKNANEMLKAIIND